MLVRRFDWMLNTPLYLARYTPWTEASFPAPGRFDGARPENFVSVGPGIVAGMICARPQATDIALVIEVSSSTPEGTRRGRNSMRVWKSLNTGW